MGKWSEETRAAFKEKLRAARAKKRKGGGSTAVVPAKSTALAVKPVRTPRSPLGDAGTIDAVAGVALDLDAAITKRQRELAVLEQAKEIVLRG